jgi:beta-N-acetylhexosaminidase
VRRPDGADPLGAQRRIARARVADAIVGLVNPGRLGVRPRREPERSAGAPGKDRRPPDRRISRLAAGPDALAPDRAPRGRPGWRDPVRPRSADRRPPKRPVAGPGRDARRGPAGQRSIIVSIDQEGGIVTRLSPAHGFPAVASEGDIGRGSDATARTWAKTIATTLANAGINLNFAPVVDLDVTPKSPAIGALDRSFSADPDVVVERATIEIEAHRAVDVRTTLKHFPGIGSSTTNTDFGVADVTKTWSRTELQPFQSLIVSGHADLVMAGHVVNGQLDATGRPASLSAPIVTDLLRGELAWSGVVVTDDLQAAAITKTFGRDEAILLALEAGNDLLLLANQQVYDPRIVTRVVDVVEGAVGSGRLKASRIDEAFDRVRAAFP